MTEDPPEAPAGDCDPAPREQQHDHPEDADAGPAARDPREWPPDAPGHTRDVDLDVLDSIEEELDDVERALRRIDEDDDR